MIMLLIKPSPPSASSDFTLVALATLWTALVEALAEALELLWVAFSFGFSSDILMPTTYTKQSI